MSQNLPSAAVIHANRAPKEVQNLGVGKEPGNLTFPGPVQLSWGGGGGGGGGGGVIDLMKNPVFCYDSQKYRKNLHTPQKISFS